MITVRLFVHATKETCYYAAERAGLTGEALERAVYLGNEHSMEYEVDETTGIGRLVRVDGKELK